MRLHVHVVFISNGELNINSGCDMKFTSAYLVWHHILHISQIPAEYFSSKKYAKNCMNYFWRRLHCTQTPCLHFGWMGLQSKPWKDESWFIALQVKKAHIEPSLILLRNKNAHVKPY